jgi:uncharacterized membrane protein YbaN (DUF454 family)
MVLLKTKSWLWIGFGHLAFAVGVVGIFVPLLPTAPFVIVAAFCYSKGSKRFEAWIINHPKLGPSVLMWRRHRVIPLKAKILATSMTGISVLWVGFLPLIPVVAKIAMFATVGAVLVFIWRCPSKVPGSE